MPTQYRAFYPNATEFVHQADQKRFPLRDRLDDAVRDAQNYWHKEGEHITPYLVQGDTVQELQVRVHRRTEVEVVQNHE